MKTLARHIVRLALGGLVPAVALEDTAAAPISAEVIQVDLRVRGDETVFVPSDELVMYAETDRDCYLVVYNVDSYGRVRLLYPGDPDDSAWVEGGRTVRIPPHGSRYDLVLGDPGVEFIAAVASDDQIDVARWFPDKNFAGLEDIYWDEALDKEGFSRDYWVEEDPARAIELVNARIAPERRRANGYGEETLALRVRHEDRDSGDRDDGNYDGGYSEVEIHHYVHTGPRGWDPWWCGPYDPFWVRSGWSCYDPWYYDSCYDPWYDDYSWRVSVHVGNFRGWRHRYPVYSDGYWYPGVVVVQNPVCVVKWKTYQGAITPGSGSPGGGSQGSQVKWKGAPAKVAAVAAVASAAPSVKARATKTRAATTTKTKTATLASKPKAAPVKPQKPKSTPGVEKSSPGNTGEIVRPRAPQRAKEPHVAKAPHEAKPPAAVKEAPEPQKPRRVEMREERSRNPGKSEGSKKATSGKSKSK